MYIVGLDCYAYWCYKELVGVLVRLTTCKRLTDSLPKPSLPCNTLPSPLRRRDSRSAGYSYAGGPVNIRKRFHFLGIPAGGELFKYFSSSRHGGKSEKVFYYWWMVGLKPTRHRKKKNTVCRRRHFLLKGIINSGALT